MTTTDADVRAYYDAAPYASFAYLQCAPEHLAAIAHLFGLSAPPVARARVLELGGSSGGNLIPVAVRNPGASVLGMDISGSHIALGQAQIARLGLDNAELREANLTEVDIASLGQFDYIICHGFYSWIPPHVQEAMMETCQRALAPDGVAYVSYNTYPGWKSREMIRDAMLLHSRGKATVQERLAHARAMVGFLKQVAPKDGLMARVVEENMRILSRTGDDYLAHDYLEPYNLPCYFQDFVAHAGRHGLAYLAEAEPSRMIPDNYGRDVANALNASFGHDQVLMEQYLDFAVNRTFRQTLLVHAERAATVRHRLDRARLRSLHFAANLPCLSGSTRFDGSAQAYGQRNGPNLSSSHASVKLAADTLTARWPGTVSRDQLLAAVAAGLPADQAVPVDTLETAIDELLEYLVGRGMARLRLEPVPLAADAGAFPRIEAGARRLLAALQGEDRFITNLWHEAVELTPEQRALYPLMDGSRSRDALAQVLAADSGAAASDARSRLDRLLEGARVQGLLA